MGTTRPQLHILCDDVRQCENISHQVAPWVDILYAGPIGKRPKLKNGNVVLLDLTHESSDDFLDVLNSSNSCVINQTDLHPLSRIQLTAWRTKLLAQIAERTCSTSEYASQRREDTKPRSASRLWVLCASTDGPHAIGDFLEALGDHCGESFLVLQHIKDTFVKPLREQLNRRTGMKVIAPERSERVKPDSVYICPPGKTPRYEKGRLVWDNRVSRRFSPCIDESLISLAGSMGNRVSAVVFSGMGSDCLRGCFKVVELGGEVWAQDLDTAMIGSMPRCVTEAGITKKIGSPKELAEFLILSTRIS